jgi:large exoprotein involved in heme utilization and adhesion
LATGGLKVAPGAATDSALWQGANLPTQTQAGGRTQVEIKQTQQKAILNWDTFNVGRDTTLYFNKAREMRRTAATIGWRSTVCSVRQRRA